MKFLRDIPYLDNVKVLVRVDFNVPVENGVVVDDFRIRSCLATINHLREHGARVILMAHTESISGDNGSLKPAADSLNKLGVPALFIPDIRNAHEIIENKLQSGGCCVLENLRFDEGEKKNDAKFSEQLASLGDIYVNEAFSVSHRKHASIVGVPRFLPSYAGLQFEKEVANLSRAFKPDRPFLLVMGGAKFDTKLPLLQKFFSIADKIFVGGALAHDIYKAKGYEIGKSLVSSGIDNGLNSYINDPKLIIPCDVVVENGIVKDPSGLSSSDSIMDAGPRTMEVLSEEIVKAKFILWNGPLGHYEGGYKGPTLELAKMIGDATKKIDGSISTNDSEEVVSIVGGGDTLAAIEELGIFEEFTFVSTAGGAMLDYLSTETLPGIKALDDSL